MGSVLNLLLSSCSNQHTGICFFFCRYKNGLLLPHSGNKLSRKIRMLERCGRTSDDSMKLHKNA